MRYIAPGLMIIFFATPAFALDYNTLRKELIADGWVPAPQTSDTDCFARQYTPVCQKYPEIRFCIETDNAPCKMEWVRRNERKAIFTEGDATKNVVDVLSSREATPQPSSNVGTIIILAPLEPSKE
jgi:hypothetical protein